MQTLQSTCSSSWTRCAPPTQKPPPQVSRTAAAIVPKAVFRCHSIALTWILPLSVGFQLSRRIRERASQSCGMIVTAIAHAAGKTEVRALAVMEGQLTWLVQLVGAIIRGRLSSSSAESQVKGGQGALLSTPLPPLRC